MKQLNLLSHFNFNYSNAEHAYIFSTDDDVNYFVTFLEYQHVMDVEFPIYSFIIDRYPENKKSKDLQNKIRNTILIILSNFFENNQSALVAIYDSLDGKQLYRKKLFNKWYNEFNGGIIKKKEGKFKANNEETYAIAIYSSNHQFCSEIEEKFEKLLKKNFYNE